MIEPNDFYSHEDGPAAKSRSAMWRRIRRSSPGLRRETVLIADTRSFLYGMAATLVIGLALLGAWTLARQSFENAQPTPLRLEQAYVSAIHEFERVVPAVATKSANQPRLAGQLRSRQEQLNLINAAIADLRRETNGKDLSPMKRDNLRGLYSQELKILQEMIEEGEIEL
jgi:hypothetical protein